MYLSSSTLRRMALADSRSLLSVDNELFGGDEEYPVLGGSMAPFIHLLKKLSFLLLPISMLSILTSMISHESSPVFFLWGGLTVESDVSGRLSEERAIPDILVVDEWEMGIG